ncbi:MAG: SRPBCC family protein [Thermoanaerobaculia bacterium]|nr:SRPBCC family protein [Thermoanaerobaculia bacterium]
MRFERRFRVAAPRQAVVEFHRRPEGFRALAPPLAPLTLHQAPAELDPGARLSFTLWMGPLPVRWTARIEAHDGGFADTQEEGPFESWRHRHTFVAVDESTTEVRDQIEARLPSGLARALVALAVWLGLPALFAYRRWKTRRVLE